jgi:hypothetical protein
LAGGRAFAHRSLDLRSSFSRSSLKPQAASFLGSPFESRAASMVLAPLRPLSFRVERTPSALSISGVAPRNSCATGTGEEIITLFVMVPVGALGCNSGLMRRQRHALNWQSLCAPPSHMGQNTFSCDLRPLHFKTTCASLLCAAETDSWQHAHIPSVIGVIVWLDLVKVDEIFKHRLG